MVGKCWLCYDSFENYSGSHRRGFNSLTIRHLLVMKYQIQFRTRRRKDQLQKQWENPWHDYDTDTQTVFGPTTIVVKSDNLNEIKRSLDYMHNNCHGMVDHRIISVIDESGIFPPG